MIKLLYIFTLWRKRRSPEQQEDRRNDALSDPVIRKMTADELADLPFSSMREHSTC